MTGVMMATILAALAIEMILAEAKATLSRFA